MKTILKSKDITMVEMKYSGYSGIRANIYGKDDVTYRLGNLEICQILEKLDFEVIPPTGRDRFPRLKLLGVKK